ncbi:LolA family protein [Flavobacterium oreochromis]|uniref:LolA family protein n=1 Tax=Flavobacterium oreochromis TaxID=2906078 RepID=UPI00385DE8B4
MKKSLIILLFFCQGMRSQNAEAILKKATSCFEQNKSISFVSKYQLFKTYTSKEVIEYYVGAFKKSGNEIYQKIGNTEFIQSNNKSLKIINKEKTMVYSANVAALNQNAFDLKLLEKTYKVKTAIDRKDYWEIELESKQFTSVIYGKIVLWITKNYTLKKQLFYYSIAVDFSKKHNKNDLEMPRLEVDIQDFNLNASLPKSVFDMSSYVAVSGSSIKPIGKYSKYKVIVQK